MRSRADAAADPLPRGRLGEPLPARPRLRRLFDPATGWFRRTEREASHWLTRHVYPLVPGLHLVYDWQLRRSLTLSEAVVRVPGLAPGLHGLRLLLISDVHAGPFVSPRVVEESLDRLASVEPDAVLIAGDFATSRLREFVRVRRAFTRLRAPLGTFAVLGNHDHYTEDPPRLRGLIEACGIEVLHNRWIALERESARLTLAGVDDLLSGQPDLDAALDGAPGPVVLLSHNPDVLFDAARRDVALVLSGHTHAGQVRVPGLPVLVRQSRYRLDEGRYRVGATELIVSRGLGAVGLPVRVACPPEAVLVQLVGGQQP